MKITWLSHISSHNKDFNIFLNKIVLVNLEAFKGIDLSQLRCSDCVIPKQTEAN